MCWDKVRLRVTERPDNPIGLQNLEKGSPTQSSAAEVMAFRSQMAEAVLNIRQKTKSLSVPEIRRILLRAVSVLVASPKVGTLSQKTEAVDEIYRLQLDSDIVHYLVELPVVAFTPLAIAAGVDAWTWLLRQRAGSEIAVIGEITAGWLETIRAGKGLFNRSME